MRGRVAKALRRTRLTSERLGDRKIVMRMAERQARLQANQPKPLKERKRKPAGMSFGLQGYSDAQMLSLSRLAPIVIKPMRALRQVAHSLDLSLGQYLRHQSEGLLRGEKHAGQQPKWMLNRLAETA
jgi:hypothetical protein